MIVSISGFQSWISLNGCAAHVVYFLAEGFKADFIMCQSNVEISTVLVIVCIVLNLYLQEMIYFFANTCQDLGMVVV